MTPRYPRRRWIPFSPCLPIIRQTSSKRPIYSWFPNTRLGACLRKTLFRVSRGGANAKQSFAEARARTVFGHAAKCVNPIHLSVTLTVKQGQSTPSSAYQCRWMTLSHRYQSVQTANPPSRRAGVTRPRPSAGGQETAARRERACASPDPRLKSFAVKPLHS